MQTELTVPSSPPSELRAVRRQHLAVACLVGPLIGLAATAFQYAVSLVTRMETLVVSQIGDPTARLTVLILLCATCGGGAGYLTQRMAPEAGGSGIPHVKAVLAHLKTLHGLRVLLVKFVGGALTIGSRFSLGREGPTIHMGAAIAAEINKRTSIPLHLRDHVIACGAGAGLAAAFNAPLAGFLFIIEELRREAHSITLGMALLATVLADAVVRLCVGAQPILPISDLVSPYWNILPTLAAITLVGTAAGLLFNETLMLLAQRTPQRFPAWFRGAFMGCIVALCVWYLPSVTLDQHGTVRAFVGTSLGAHTPAAVLLGLFCVKLGLTAACYATGVPGGIFAPMLVQGVFVGLSVAKLMSLTGLAVPTDAVAALIGMTAFFAASVRAPFTGVVLLAEMTNGFTLLLPLMGAALVAYLIGELSGSRPIYERLLLSREKTPEPEKL
jgi:CIC family chloride channel protein